MGKTHPFSIYLLKPGFDATNSLDVGHNLQMEVADELPAGASLYILDAQPKPPWWKAYFGVQKPLLQQHKGALVFIPIANRCFAFCFGQVFHHLNDVSYEYDFGLRVTLNSLDPKELKSADMIEPGAARRKRTQVPVSTELTYLDFDGNSEIIKSLTGKVKKDYQALFKNATGSSALKISLKIKAGDLAGICNTLFDLYGKDDYKTTFPNIQNIAPVKDPIKISELDKSLLKSLQEKDGFVTLSIPDVVDYHDNTCCVFIGNGKISEIFPDISLEQFYEFLGEDFNLGTLTIDSLKTYRMMLTDVEGNYNKGYSVYRALMFETEEAGANIIYHLCDGSWYKVEKEYVTRLKDYLDQKCEDSDLCDYDHDNNVNGKASYSEENYNSAVSIWKNEFICLDQTDISPAGNTQIEPCDIYTSVKDDSTPGGYRGLLYHIKISTRSSHLSHLFNQGVNSIELIIGEAASQEKMKQLILNKLNGNHEQSFLAPLQSFDFKVIFGIVTHKNKTDKSSNLPLFSKISLMRNMQRLHVMRVPSALTFIRDVSPKKGGHAKNLQIIVEVNAGQNGKVEVRPVAGQGVDVDKPIKACPKEIRESAIGTKYQLEVRKSEDGELSSYHKWPFHLVP